MNHTFVFRHYARSKSVDSLFFIPNLIICCCDLGLVGCEMCLVSSVVICSRLMKVLMLPVEATDLKSATLPALLTLLSLGF